MSDWTQFFKQSTWPAQPTEQQSFELDENPLIAAAQALALLCYPVKAEQKIGGPAHRFCEALLAEMWRLAQKQGRLETQPAWILELKQSSMRSRVERGRIRLSNAFAALQTVFAAVMLESNNEAALAGERRTFNINSSPDFRRMTITMPVQEVPGGFALVGAIPQVAASSLRAAIISHREAFGKGRGDPQEEYVNIYNRHVRPMFRLFSLLMVVWETVISKATEAHARELGPLDILMLQPEWAERLDLKTQARQGQAIWFLRHIGIPICSCRMLEIAQRQ